MPSVEKGEDYNIVLILLSQGENKFTFVEECKNPKSVTLLLRGPTKHGIAQMKVHLRLRLNNSCLVLGKVFDN